MMPRIFSTAVSILIASMVVIGSLSIIPARAEELTVICYGGTFEDGWRKSVVKRFEEKYPGDKITIATGLTMQVAAKMRAQKENAEIDVVLMDEVGAAQCAAEGLFEPMSEQKVPNLKNLLPQFKKGTGPRLWSYFFWEVEALAYNTEKFKTPPDSWKVMFDPKYSGHISYPDISTSHGVWMLNMASRLFGGNEKKMDPGFEAIKKIRGGIHSFWTVHGQIQQLMASGDVWLTSEATDRIAPLKVEKKPVDWIIPKEGAYILSSTIGIAKGTKHLDLAYRYINFVLDAQTQALNALYINIMPVVKDAAVDQSIIKSRLVPAPSDLSKLYDLDWDVVNKERSDWTERWRREIAVK
jgi:putative spermidine/putrescine transport system substrate-binding protein